MKRMQTFLQLANPAQGRQALKGGSYALVLTAVVLAILIVVNVLFSALPAAWTKLDISSSKLYSITGNTKVVVNALEEDVSIYWIVQAGEEDDVIENLLSRYETLSDHLTVTKKNPDVYPTFAQQYTSEDAENNSLVVECGDRYRYISYEDIYPGTTNAYTGTYSADSFDGEGAITSAIAYVTSTDFPKVYTLEGHGETDLPQEFSDQIEQENIELDTLSLLTSDGIPEDADCLIIYAPASDISDQEKTMLADYVSGGGKLFVAAGAVEDGILENLYSLLEEYGVSVNEGIVIEGDREHYAFGTPYILMPDMTSNDLTDSLLQANYSVLLPIALGLTTGGETEKGTVTEFLTTSDSAFSKTAGYALTTYDKEDGDIDGPFALGISVADNSGGGIVWFSSSEFLAEEYNSYSSGANLDLAMNGLASLVGESETMAIRSKSLNYNYLTISQDVSALLQALMVGVFPLVYLGAGIGVVLYRKKVQNAAL